MAMYSNTEGCLPNGQTEPFPAEVHSVLMGWERGFPLLSWGKQRDGAWPSGK